MKHTAPAPADSPHPPVLVTLSQRARLLRQRQGLTLRALATTGAQRSPLLPDVPTIAEAGYPSLQFSERFGFFVPAKTPSETVEKLSGALRAALQTKEVQVGLAAQSVDVGGLTTAEFARQVKADFDRWAPIVKESGFTPLD
jgi:tripartite-type tricarboxylate transporter receptor subunit TctC